MRRLMIGSLLLLVVSAACDSQPPVAPTPPAPFGGPVPGVGSLATSSVSCIGGLSPLTNLNLLVTAAGTQFTLNSVTIHLIDGSNVGGRSITFPSANLTSQFGNTLVPVGTTRPFDFLLGTGCLPPQVVQVNVVVVDGSGTSQVLSTTATIP